jgi:transcriptional regulator with XRE-family HTH domain
MEPRRITHKQASAARLLLGWTQHAAAERASITISSVSEAEHFFTSEVIKARLRAAYEGAGVEFINEGQPRVSLRKDGPSARHNPRGKPQREQR